MNADNNHLQYVHMPNVGPGMNAPPGQAYGIPDITLTGTIGSKRPDQGRKISQQKTLIGFTNDNGQLYDKWRQTVKDQMLSRNYTNVHALPNNVFLDILRGMRRLRPACDRLVTAQASQNPARINAIDDAIIHLLKDCGKRLTHTILAKAGQGEQGPTIAPQDVAIDVTLLPPGAPANWGHLLPAPKAGPALQGAPNAPHQEAGGVQGGDAGQNDALGSMPQAGLVGGGSTHWYPGQLAANAGPAPQGAPNAPLQKAVGAQAANASPNAPQQAAEVQAANAGQNAPQQQLPQVQAAPPDNIVVPYRKCNGTDWNALLGRPRAVRLVWVRPSRRRGSQGQAHGNKNLTLHWRHPHIHGMQFCELDSYDFRGLCAMIARWVPNHRIRYIIGATGEGRRLLLESPDEPLPLVEVVFIEGHETLRTWLLSNPVKQDPLDLLVHCYRDRDDGRPSTPPIRGHAYLNEADVIDWGRDPGAPVGLMHYRVPALNGDAEGRSDDNRVPSA